MSKGIDVAEGGGGEQAAAAHSCRCGRQAKLHFRREIKPAH
jgi:hypothetical protein